MPNGVPMTWMAALYEHPPVMVERGSGGTFIDVDGNEYVDFNLADTSMFTGYGVEAFARAVGERAAAGPQFLLPGEDAAQVAEELGRRFGLPFWQFTLSATREHRGHTASRAARSLKSRAARPTRLAEVQTLATEVDHGHASRPRAAEGRGEGRTRSQRPQRVVASLESDSQASGEVCATTFEAASRRSIDAGGRGLREPRR